MTATGEGFSQREDEARARFQRQTALLIAVIAVLLAINSLGGGNAAEDAVNANILASDAWAFFQAKNVRQTVYMLAKDDLTARPELGGRDGDAGRQALQDRIAICRATIDRYASEPDPGNPADFLKGEGKRELSQWSRYCEAQRDQALARESSFNIAEVLFQLAVVLAPGAILATSRPARAVASLFALVGVIFMANGYLLLARSS